MNTDDVVVRLDKIAEQQEELKKVVSGIALPKQARHGVGFYMPRLGRGLIVAAALGVFYFITRDHHNVVGDLSATVHGVTGVTGGLVAGTAIVIAGVRMAGLPVRRRDKLFDGLRLIEFIVVWPIVLAAAADYSSSFEDTGPVLTVAALALTMCLFVDFGWSVARQAHDIAPWRSWWVTHALMIACLLTTIVVWDLPFLSSLRHQLVNVDTEAEISNVAVFAGLGCTAIAYLIGLKGKSPGR